MRCMQASRRAERRTQKTGIAATPEAATAIPKHHHHRPAQTSVSVDKQLPKTHHRDVASPPRSTAIHRYALLAPALALTEIVEGVSSSLPAPSFGLSQVRMCPVNISLSAKCSIFIGASLCNTTKAGVPVATSRHGR